jgi:hypothetical protein
VMTILSTYSWACSVWNSTVAAISIPGGTGNSGFLYLSLKAFKKAN